MGSNLDRFFDQLTERVDEGGCHSATFEGETWVGHII
jgi:hypothetical protein